MSTAPQLAVSSPGSRDGWWLGLLFVVVLVIGSGLLILTAGHVSGVEFSPSTLERRQFWFYEVPWIHWQVRGVRYLDKQSEMELFLLTQPYFSQASSATPAWHLVTGAHGWAEQTGEADILIQYLDSRDYQGHLQWAGWTDDHPKLAAELWPVVLALAAQHDYLKIPDAMDQAKRAETAEELKAALEVIRK